MTVIPGENTYFPSKMTWEYCIFLIALVLLCCENRQEPEGGVTILPSENPGWITYEGRVPLNESTNLYIVSSLLPSDHPGEGSYKIQEFLETGETDRPTASFKGKYSTLYGETPEERIIQFHHSGVSEGYERTYVTSGFSGSITGSKLRMIRTEPFRTTDLTVVISGRNKLIVLDAQQKATTADKDFNLVRRKSKLFTIEGYFRHTGDSAHFFEMNTGETWAVCKYGDYRKAIRQYHQLTNKKFEVTYLKAVGFSIDHINKAGGEVEALVIKKVLQMTAAPSVEE